MSSLPSLCLFFPLCLSLMELECLGDALSGRVLVNQAAHASWRLAASPPIALRHICAPVEGATFWRLAVVRRRTYLSVVRQRQVAFGSVAQWTSGRLLSGK